MSDLMSAEGSPPNPRADRPETLERLLDAARTIGAREGFERLTIQAVAAEAGVSMTDAHAYFGSNAQVVSEVLWRQLISPSGTPAASGDTASRDRNEMRADALDLLRLRARTAGKVQRRIRAALGRRHDIAIAERLEAIYTAALFDAGVGYAGLSQQLRSPENLVQRILDRR